MIMKKLLLSLLIVSGFLTASAQYEEWIRYGFVKGKDVYYGFTDKYGKIVVTPKYAFIAGFKNELARVSNSAGAKSESDRYGYIDAKGKEVIKLTYKNAKDFSEGLAAVTMDYETPIVPAKWGYIDVSGKLAIPYIYDTRSDFKEGLAVQDMRFQKKSIFFIDKTGKKVLPAANSAYEYYISGNSFSEGLARVQIPNGIGFIKAVFIDKSGKIVIDDGYEFTGDFKNGVASVYKAGKFGFVDKTGKVVVPIAYARVDPAHEGFVKVFDKDKKVAVFSVTGKEIAPMGKYNEVWGFREGLSAVRIGGKFGFINENGDLAIQPTFAFGGYFSDGMARLTDNLQNGYIDKTGKLVIPYKAGVGTDFSEGLAAFRFDSENKLYGYIDKTGKIILPAIYENAGPFKNGFARVTKKYVDFLIDKTGKSVRSTDISLKFFNDAYTSESLGDNIKAYQYYKLAEWKGNKDAAMALKRLGAEGVKAYVDQMVKRGMDEVRRKDYGSALYTFSELDKENSKEALYYLGHLNAFGLGTPQNYPAALQFMERAAKLGHIEASTDLALLYINGLGTPKDFVKAKEYLLLAAKSDNARAMFSLASLYFTGQGVEKNLQVSKDWLMKAARLNYQPALDLLKNNAAAFN